MPNIGIVISLDAYPRLSFVCVYTILFVCVDIHREIYIEYECVI